MAFRRWIWVEDTKTGHRFDVEERQLERLLKAKAVEPVPDYPVNEGQNVSPRRPKHNVNLGKRDASAGASETPAAETATTPPPTPASTRRGNRTAAAAPEADTTSAEGADK